MSFTENPRSALCSAGVCCGTVCTAKLILYTKGVEMGQDIIVLGT